MDIFKVKINQKIEIISNQDFNRDLDVIVYDSNGIELYRTSFYVMKNIIYWVSIDQLDNIQINILDSGNVIYSYNNILKNEIFLITAYCDSEEKNQQLRDCISDIKKYNLDICIYSHYVVPLDIQKEVNYCIYDYSNPIINFTDDNKCLINWQTLPSINRKVVAMLDDYGYAVMSQWKNGINFLNNLKYDNFHIINYDVFFTEKFFKENRLQLSNNDAVFYYFDDYRDFELNLMIFSIKNNFSNVFFSSLSRENYLQDGFMLETHIQSKIEKFRKKYNIVKNEFHSYGGYAGTEDSSELNHKIGHNALDNNDLVTVFGGINIKTNLFELVFFNIKKQIKKTIEIIMNKETTIIDNIQEPKILTFDLTIFDLERIIDNIEIKINGVEIDKHIYRMFLTNQIEFLDEE